MQEDKKTTALRWASTWNKCWLTWQDCSAVAFFFSVSFGVFPLRRTNEFILHHCCMELCIHHVVPSPSLMEGGYFFYFLINLSLRIKKHERSQLGGEDPLCHISLRPHILSRSVPGKRTFAPSFRRRHTFAFKSDQAQHVCGVDVLCSFFCCWCFLLPLVKRPLHLLFFLSSVPGKPSQQHPQQLVDVSVSLRSVIKGVDDEWFNRMAARYGSWVSAAEYGVLTWGLFVFKKKSVSECVWTQLVNRRKTDFHPSAKYRSAVILQLLLALLLPPLPHLAQALVCVIVLQGISLNILFTRGFPLLLISWARPGFRSFVPPRWYTCTVQLRQETNARISN